MFELCVLAEYGGVEFEVVVVDVEDVDAGLCERLCEVFVDGFCGYECDVERYLEEVEMHDFLWKIIL